MQPLLPHLRHRPHPSLARQAGQAHGGWYRDYTAPEANETFEEIAKFFDRYLGR